MRVPILYIWDETAKEYKGVPAIQGTPGPPGAPSDWNANEGEPGHILNRPFYTETFSEEVLPEQLYDFQGPLPPANLVVGETYIVKYNDVTYEAVAKASSAYVELIQYDSNFKSVFEVFEDQKAGHTYADCFGRYTEITISITKKSKADIVHKIPEKYLPDNIGDGAQADWDAGENEPGHILNRPFYSETRYKTIVDQAEMVYEETEGLFYLFQAPQLAAGQLYTITVNGTEYPGTAQDLSEFMGDGAVAFGDLSALSEDFAGITGNGEPFVLATLPSAGVTMFAPLFECTEVTLSIAGSAETVHPIPAKYLANVRAQKRYILNCDTQIASAAAPSPEEADTGELQAAITVIYQGTEHAAVVTERISHTIEGITVHVVEFFFADHNRNIRTGRWNHSAVYVDELIYTFAGKFQANDTAGTAPWLYAVPASNSSPVWYSMQNLTLPGITLQSPNGTKFRVTVDNSGNLTATQK